jgi:hypothetical protein
MTLRTQRIAGRLPAALMLAVTAVAVTACGGGGSGSTPPPAPANAAPTVTGLSNLTINQDTPTQAIAFTLNDDGGVNGLTVSAATSDAGVVPSDGIQLAGTGANRTLTITPAEDATGQVNITVTAQDAQGLTGSSTFGLTVTAVQKSIASYTTTTFAQDENDAPAQVSGFTFVQDADDATTFDPLLQ